MKNTQKLLILSLFLLTVISCSKNENDIGTTAFNEVAPLEEVNKTNATNNTSVGNPYTVLLESVTNNGDNTWTWVWSVQNPNPGNGNNGTAQGLSHWGFAMGACVQSSNLLGAGYSSNGTDWTNFTPSIERDPSQGCLTTPVLKFELGTNNSEKAWYRVVINRDLPVNNNTLGVYKSGSRTGCGTFPFPGIGCPDIIVEIVE